MDEKSIMSTGFQPLDEILGGGFHSGSLTVIAGRPGMGKTAFSLYCAAGMAKNTHKKIYIFSMEMSPDYIKKTYAGPWRQSNVMVDGSAPITPSQMRAKLSEVSDLGAVIVDYFQLLQPDDNSCEQNARMRAEEITEEMKRLSVELGVPVICSSQLSRRRGAGKPHRPVLSDLEFSGFVEAEADVVIFSHRDAYYDTDERTDRFGSEITVARNRHGDCGTFWFDFERILIL